MSNRAALFPSVQKPQIGIAARIGALGEKDERKSRTQAILAVFLRLFAACSGEVAGVTNAEILQRSTQSPKRAMLFLCEQLPNLRHETLIAKRAERFSMTSQIGALTAVICLDLLAAPETERTEANEALILRGMPWFVLSIDSSYASHLTASTGKPDFIVAAGAGTENIMAALSLEDAARSLGFSTVLDDKTPLRASTSKRAIYGEDITQPGVAAFLFLPSSEEAHFDHAQAAADLLIKATDILERRLDIARASVAQGRGEETRLLKALESN